MYYSVQKDIYILIGTKVKRVVEYGCGANQEKDRKTPFV